ncbi:M23 family metallopeptidase [Corynebacterium halotolerans]|uniref:M23ase beta-sheet core domain-containing protein n=1 Tax=Corynebacterium halotolerans YIM 70093 = DSM 44683 TaxID=1121362 RepID=M1MVU2_9CORY|nr:M23 family metallopeptidase [Corynebacterium halotolerans]AGF71864.1 hypothetical protein A605_04265 [Corynebacterium halotolerans YIM 70093 = DSM 44683]
MLIKAQRSTGGRHRKFTASQTTKGRVALVAVATGTVSSAGAGGAAAATLQSQSETPASPEVANVDYELANDAAQMSSSLAGAAPQILAISEFKPVSNIEDQLTKAVQYSVERAQADLAARAPSVVKPAEGAFTSGYGMRWGTLHAGIDIAAPIGTPIVAVMDGTVIDSGPASGYGQWIRIQHDDGSMSVYGHMSTLDVGVGERVTAGQKIAGMGNEGFSTGSHLHFEIHPTGNGAVDPVPWFAERGITIA